MDPNENNVIVALIPQNDEWCKIEPAHMTMVFVGLKENLKPNIFNSLAKDVASIAMLSNPIMAKVIGKDILGDNERVDVMLISPTPEILAIRNMLEDWDVSDFPSFNPHVTIGPVGTFIDNMPMYLVFDRIMILWGTDRLTFWLRKY